MEISAFPVYLLNESRQARPGVSATGSGRRFATNRSFAGNRKSAGRSGSTLVHPANDNRASS
jgi:hypothetical protein